jgi:c-di-GMP-binding flagellar brake protein YcgR
MTTEPDLSRFTVENRGDILDILDRLHDKRALTTVEFGDGNAIVSSILEVRRGADTIVFDIARDPETNKSLFASGTLAFVSELDNVQIAFKTRPATFVSLADGPAAVVELPFAVTRLQRREWFRAKLPIQPQVRCTVLDEDGNASPAQAIDLSCGGAGVIVDEPALRGAKAGSGHELILSLPEVGRLAVEATLRTIKEVLVRPASESPKASHRNGLTSKLRLGFRFEGVPMSTTKQIQRYVNRLEVTQLRVLRLRNR